MSEPAGRLIYVVGSSRSGTTMLSHMLGGHRLVHPLFESHFAAEICPADQLHQPRPRAELQPMAAALLARQRLVHSRYVRDEAAAGFAAEANQLLAGLPATATPYQLFAAHLRAEAQHQGKTIAVEQTPRHLFFLADLLRAEPEARAIVLMRDARDVILSQKHKWRAVQQQSPQMARAARRFWANYHPITTSLMWNRAAAAAQALAGDPRVRLIQFETLVTEPDPTLQSICRFLDLAFTPEMLQVAADENSSFGQNEMVGDRVGVNPSAAYRWRRDRANRHDLAVCQRLCRRQLLALGYRPAAHLEPGPLDYGRALMTWPLKTATALLFNPQRGQLLAGLWRRGK